jgi:hypothetical protein
VHLAGILIEDQAWPKSCGHVQSKLVVSRDEARARVQAAVDARDGGADLLIVARTDARQVCSPFIWFIGSSWRCTAYHISCLWCFDIMKMRSWESEKSLQRLKCHHPTATS